MKDEGTIAGKGRISFSTFRRPVVGWLCRGEVRNIQAGPLLLRFVPPDQFLTLAPRPAIGTRRRAVIQDAAIGRPGKRPTVSVEILGLAFVGTILTGSGKDAGINPTAARGGPISLQIPVTTNQRAIG